MKMLMSLLVFLLGAAFLQADLDMKGVCYGSWEEGHYQTSDANISLNNLAKTKTNYVGLVVTWYMDHPQSNLIFADNSTEDGDKKWTPTDADIRHAIREIHQRKMKVMLKMHLNVKRPKEEASFHWNPVWAGEVEPVNPEKWFDQYKAFALHYAKIAQEEKVELLCWGTELISMTSNPKEKPGQDYTKEWRNLIEKIRQNYSGKLTFSADFYWEYEKIAFWDLLDYAGLGVYFDLVASENANPSLAEIKEAWEKSWNWPKNIVGALETWQRKIKKPVIFTEIGYCSVDKCTYRPWEGMQSYSENEGLQARAYEAAFKVFSQRPWFKGFFWWVWYTKPYPKKDTQFPYNKDYTPQGKKAQEIIEKWYNE